MTTSIIEGKTSLHPLQTQAWGKYYKALGFKVLRHKISDKNGNQDTLQFFLQKSKVDDQYLAYLPRTQFPTKEHFSVLKEIISEHACLSLKVEPNYGWLHPMSKDNDVDRSQLIKLMQSCGGIKSNSIYAKYTLLIPLTMPDDIQLQTMHQKTRYNILLSERKNVTILQDTSDACFEEFLRIFFQETVPRAGIDYSHSASNLKLFWKVMKPTGNLHLLKATYRGDTAAIMVLLKIGDRLYFPHGASNRGFKSRMPNYRLLWEAIRLGKSLGCSVLDLWGIREPLSCEENGLFRFFSGFGAATFEWVGAYDFLRS